MDGAQLSQDCSAILRRQFTTKSQEVPGAHFIDLGRMKG